MSLLQILQAPHPGLKRVARPVAEITDELHVLMHDMLETMYRAPGIGLAAPQVGIDKRVVVIDISRDDAERKPMRLINPELLWKSEETIVQEEGCLSLPEQYAKVKRASAVRMRYMDEHGSTQEIAADDILARCLQHELDHLDGILFVDYLSPLRRNMILRKLEKAKRPRD